MPGAKQKEEGRDRDALRRARNIIVPPRFRGFRGRFAADVTPPLVAAADLLPALPFVDPAEWTCITVDPHRPHHLHPLPMPPASGGASPPAVAAAAWARGGGNVQ